jgi:hypothetical protein
MSDVLDDDTDGLVKMMWADDNMGMFYGQPIAFSPAPEARDE